MSCWMYSGNWEVTGMTRNKIFAKLRRKNIAAADNGVRALPQRLDPVKLRILNCDMIGIPESGPAGPSKEQSFTIISRLP